MPLDLDKYRPLLDGTDLDEAQQEALIHSLWTLMEGLADRAFGLHPVQQVAASALPADANGKADRVDSHKQSLGIHFKHADGPTPRREETDHEGE